MLVVSFVCGFLYLRVMVCVDLPCFDLSRNALLVQFAYCVNCVACGFCGLRFDLPAWTVLFVTRLFVVFLVCGVLCLRCGFSVLCLWRFCLCRRFVCGTIVSLL